MIEWVYYAYGFGLFLLVIDVVRSAYKARNLAEDLERRVTALESQSREVARPSIYTDRKLLKF
jgi:hypothetical protein